MNPPLSTRIHLPGSQAVALVVCLVALGASAATGNELPTQEGVEEVVEAAAPAATTEEAPPLVADAAAGAAKSAVCGGCHGPDGNAPNPAWPKLSGQQAEYIVKQLRDFQAGRRADPMMTAMAAPLTSQDIVNLAAHFERLEKRTTPGDPSAAKLGERLYLEGRPDEKVMACVGCHGLKGEGFAVGIEGGFPAIGGQNPAYLTKQLESFRLGARTNDYESLMQMVTADLSDEEIASLVAYLVGLGSEPPDSEIASGK